MEMKDLVNEIAVKIVDFPEKIEITEIKSEKTSVVELKVAPEDIGIVIGKKGRMAHAIRNILEAAAAKLGKRVIFEVIE